MAAVAAGLGRRGSASLGGPAQEKMGRGGKEKGERATEERACGPKPRKGGKKMKKPFLFPNRFPKALSNRF